MRNASAKKRQHPISSHLELCSVQTGGMSPFNSFHGAVDGAGGWRTGLIKGGSRRDAGAAVR